MDGPELLTIPQVAAQLQVSRQTVYALFERGELARTKVGRVSRVRRGVLERYLDRQTKRRKTGTGEVN